MTAVPGSALLRSLAATARPAGSESEREARIACADWLRDAGFVVDERPFSYSTFPGRWATPLAGFTLLMTAVASGTAILTGRAQRVVFQLDALVVVAVGFAAWWTGRYGSRLIPFMRREGANLEARRGVPTVWLVAHLDSKSQPVSLLVRAAASVGVASSWAFYFALWALYSGSAAPEWLAALILGFAALFSVPILLSWIGAAGTGALDNASGVAAILEATKVVGLAVPLGVVVTSAEELGLAGARAWVERANMGVAINCDGVDDHGVLTVTTGATGSDWWRRVCGEELLGSGVRIRRALPGVLLDSTAFLERGWRACTVSRGNRRSLARIHTPRDTLARLSGTGVEKAAGLIAGLTAAIIAGSGHSRLRGSEAEAHGAAEAER